MDYGVTTVLFWILLVVSWVMFLVSLVRSVQVRRLRRRVRELEWYEQLYWSRQQYHW